MRREIGEVRRKLEAATQERCQLMLQAFDSTARRLAASVVEERAERQRGDENLKALCQGHQHDSLAAAGEVHDAGQQKGQLPAQLAMRVDALEQVLVQVAKYSDVKCVEADL